MYINTDTIFSMTQANQNFSVVARAADRAGEAGCRTWDSRPFRNKRTWDSLRGAGRGGRNRKGHARKDAGPPAPAHGLDEAGQKARQPVQKAALLLPASAGHEPGRTR